MTMSCALINVWCLDIMETGTALNKENSKSERGYKQSQSLLSIIFSSELFSISVDLVLIYTIKKKKSAGISHFFFFNSESISAFQSNISLIFWSQTHTFSKYLLLWMKQFNCFSTSYFTPWQCTDQSNIINTKAGIPVISSIMQFTYATYVDLMLLFFNTEFWKKISLCK